MNDDLNQNIGSESTADLQSILINSLLGTIGVMWILGGILAVLRPQKAACAIDWRNQLMIFVSWAPL